jgi:cytoskeletal protein CcmA (bactofilin family)
VGAELGTGTGPGPATLAAAPQGVTIVERRRADDTAGAAAGTSAFLGSGCRINGKVELEGVARIEGHVEGDVVAQGTLIVGENAVVKAKVSGATVIVHGRITGDVTVRERLEIRAQGSVIGNVSAPKLVVHEGGTLEGQCSMGGGSKERRSTPPAAASAS